MRKKDFRNHVLSHFVCLSAERQGALVLPFSKTVAFLVPIKSSLTGGYLFMAICGFMSPLYFIIELHFLLAATVDD